MHKFSKWIKKYFIPHEKNNYKPHFLRHESMLLVFFIVIIIELGFLIQVFIVFDKTNFLASVLPGVLTTLTNEERAQNNAEPLVQNELLVKAAEMKAQDMATRGYFAHTSPDGKTPWYWLDQVGYHYSSAGENLAVNFFDSGAVAEAWMNSPTHRENIVKKNYKEIGIGVATGVYEGRSTVFVAQFFGTPVVYAAPSEPTTPANPTTNPTPTPVKPKPPITTPPKTTPPTVTPPTSQNVAVAPSAIRVLGEENTPAVVTKDSTFTNVKTFIENALTSPRQYASFILAGILIIIILALCLAIFIRSEMTHPLIVARGAALVAIVLALLFINIKVLHFETKVPTESLEASVVAY